MAARTPAFIDLGRVMVGADPEFFVKKDDKFISGHGFPCGSKEKPRKTGHGHVQNDGLALELNVWPAFTRTGFLQNFRGVVYDLAEIVSQWDRNAYIVAESVAPFSAEYLKKLPDHVSALGCNPDFNAYSLEANETPNKDVPFRTGAGHIHIGWTNNAEGMEHFFKCAELVKQLDYTIGLRTLLFDSEPRRRMLYGKAGAFRAKPYGCEYRVPSNAWCQSEELAGMMFDGVHTAIELLNEGRYLDKETEGLARECIDRNDTEWAKKYPLLADLLITDL